MLAFGFNTPDTSQTSAMAHQTDLTTAVLNHLFPCLRDAGCVRKNKFEKLNLDLLMERLTSRVPADRRLEFISHRPTMACIL